MRLDSELIGLFYQTVELFNPAGRAKFSKGFLKSVVTLYEKTEKYSQELGIPYNEALEKTISEVNVEEYRHLMKYSPPKFYGLHRIY